MPTSSKMMTTPVRFQDLDRRLHFAEELSRKDWHQHAKGGGWVERSATVAPTAFVGPRAIVLGNAQVLDFAKIVDDAIVTAAAIVAGNVYVGGKSRIGDFARISGDTRIIDADIGGFAVITNGVLSRTVLRPHSSRARREWMKAALAR